MKEKGYAAMMVGYALNHGPGTYRLYNPKQQRLTPSQSITLSTQLYQQQQNTKKKEEE